MHTNEPTKQVSGITINVARGYWIGHCEHAHVFDSHLCHALIEFFSTEGGSVLDMGCGLAHYLRHLRDAGIACDGVDGNPATPELTGGAATVVDLSHPMTRHRCFDWVLSLEVGEHIPSPFEAAFVDNVHRHNSKGIVISWAIPGQVGTGHFNTRSNDYVRNAFALLGYISDHNAESSLRKSASASWFRNTIMVFRRGTKLPDASLIHVDHAGSDARNARTQGDLLST